MNKYGNVRCELNGEKYRSQKERDRHQELLLLQRAGRVSQLKREVPFELAPAVVMGKRKKPALRYFADFTYLTGPYAMLMVEDTKGVRTALYRVKKHLMKSVHGIDVLET